MSSVVHFLYHINPNWILRIVGLCVRYLFEENIFCILYWKHSWKLSHLTCLISEVETVERCNLELQNKFRGTKHQLRISQITITRIRQITITYLSDCQVYYTITSQDFSLILVQKEYRGKSLFSKQITNASKIENVAVLKHSVYFFLWTIYYSNWDNIN